MTHTALESCHDTHSIFAFTLNDGLAQLSSLTLGLEVRLHVLYPSDLASALLGFALVLQMESVYDNIQFIHTTCDRPSNALTFGEICIMLPVYNADERHANESMHYRISC